MIGSADLELLVGWEASSEVWTWIWPVRSPEVCSEMTVVRGEGLVGYEGVYSRKKMEHEPLFHSVL